MSDQAPKLRDDPKPVKKTKVIEETTYGSPYGVSTESGIGGNIETGKTDDPYLNKTKWKNRRQMAWVSLFALIGQVIVFLLVITLVDVSVEKLKVIAEMMSWPALAFASVIGAYMGFTTWAGKKK